MLKGLGVATLLSLSVSGAALAQEDSAPPNILVIWGDDIGQFNISAMSRG